MSYKIVMKLFKKSLILLFVLLGLSISSLSSRTLLWAQRAVIAPGDQEAIALPDRDKILVAAPVPAPVPGHHPRLTFRKPQFVRGDINVDGRIDISDALKALFFLFQGETTLNCRAAADLNDDLKVDLTDPIYLLEFMFNGKDRPPAPGHVSCGVDPDDRWLDCLSFDLCGDDLPLISHVLNRMTFGPTEELLTRIQTREDLITYIEEQLNPPSNFDQAQEEPEVAEQIAELQIGYQPYASVGGQYIRLNGVPLLDGIESQWQLLQKLTYFWNNHFHTQVDTLRMNFFGRNRRGGGAARATPQLFDLIDTSNDDQITEVEWNTFRFLQPGMIPWTFFANSARSDGFIDEEEFLARFTVAYWKYGRGVDQQAISSEIEMREYNSFRRLAFSRFRDLLEVSAKSVAMIIYLNTYENTVVAPNENYGREFFELSSLGADRVYTQKDIEEVSKIFTGWTAGWFKRSDFSEGDFNFQNSPGAIPLPITNINDLRLPTAENWNDELYTWGFQFGHRNNPRLPDGGHDWGRKDIFLRRYGGTDSLGNTLTVANQLIIPENNNERTVDRAMTEFDLVLDRVVNFRDCAKFISTKLIQFFVVDDLNQLAKDNELSAEHRANFDGIDNNSDESISHSEWKTPIPFLLPNGRPDQTFEELDLNKDGEISLTEYQEPDLLVAAIDAWEKSSGNIQEVMRAILLSDEFLSLKFSRAKVKDPLELTTSAVRALDGSFRSYREFSNTVNSIQLSGMNLFLFGDPTGESELGFDWMHTVGLLERLKFVQRGANPDANNRRTFSWNSSALRTRFQLIEAERTVDFLNLLILNGDLLSAHRDLAIEQYQQANAGAQVQAVTSFLLSLPQFQKQ